MEWTFYIDSLEIEEPVGFADLVIRARRDDAWHGIFFEASTSDLQFYGVAATYLQDKKEAEGFAAEAVFKAITDCGGEDELFTGKLDFRKYQQKCGNDCLVIMPVEQEGCIMTLRNRYDQKVDLDNRTAFDGLTILPDYNGLNFDMSLAAQEQSLVNEGQDSVDELFDIKDDPAWFPNEGGIGINAYIQPFFDEIVNSSFGNFAPYTSIAFINGGFNNLPPMGQTIPILTIGTEGVDLLCGVADAAIEYRIKCQIVQTVSGTSSTVFKVKLFRLPAGGDEMDAGDYIQIYENDFGLLVNDDTQNYDIIDTIPLPDVNPGDQFFFGIFLRNGTRQPFVASLSFLQEEESYIKINGSGTCPPTDATVSLIHETASRITEAITDHCLTVKSDYYGRTDSEPYAAADDGCGSLRILTSGLRLRRAVTPKHFLSLKDAFDSLNAIDNIGMSVEGIQLRIEPVEYFYQDVQILSMDGIPASQYDVQENMAYSLVKIGYKKWETENLNGLDEFNSNKEFRSTLKSIDNTLDATSNFIAGGYPIEHTRQQSFADTGAADTKYDNDTFIVCVERMPYAYGNDYAVEQGNIENAANMYSPATAYNWRIRPMYNLMRWWKSIAQSYVNLVNTASKFLFSAGTGNLLATGNLTAYDSCRVDAVIKPENGDLFRTDMFTGQDPIWQAETINFKYPMSLKEYNLVKANPYGYIYFQCGDADFRKGYITNFLYRVAKGEADITLKLKWE